MKVVVIGAISIDIIIFWSTCLQIMDFDGKNCNISFMAFVSYVIENKKYIYSEKNHAFPNITW